MGKPINTWIIALDSKHAEIYEKPHPINPKLTLIEKLKAELQTKHEKPGTTFESIGALRHAVEPRTDPREVEQLHFITKIVKVLEEGLKNKKFARLIITAPPKMLGLLSQNLSKSLSNKLAYKLPKNILKGKIEDIEKYLDEEIDYRAVNSLCQDLGI
jgi:protein required for attachment to host cells